MTYHSIARNLAPGAQASLMQSLAPVDTNTLTLYGVTVSSDTPSSVGATATRTIVVADGPPGIIPPGQTMIDALTNLMTSQIAQAIRAPVTADAVF
jgi:hypothetical protein